MNPSHYPQVLRTRSRTPSPVPRQRVGSGGSGEERSLKAKHHRSRAASDADVAAVRGVSECVSRAEDSDGGPSQPHTHKQFLSVPQNGDASREKNFSDDDRHIPDPELKSMASVEIVSAHHSISGNSHHHVAPQDVDTEHQTASQDCEGNQAETTGSIGNGPTGRPSSSVTWSTEKVEQLRRRLKFFFMNPCSKFKARRHIPWKMFLQFFKIIIVTTQLILFGAQRSNVIEYFEHNQRALKHLLLKNWEAGYETMPYPPATGVYALYNVDDLLDYIEFTWSQYYRLPEDSLAALTLEKTRENGSVIPIRLCNRFNNYFAYPNGTYVVGPGVLQNCTDLVPLEGKDPYNIRAFLKAKNITIPYRKLLDLTLDFSFQTFHLNLIESHYGPTCYKVNATITFENYERSGQVLITLTNGIAERTCSGKVMSPQAKAEEDTVRRNNVGFDGFVIATCLLSSILCVRSAARAWKLKQMCADYTSLFFIILMLLMIWKINNQKLTEKMFRERFGKRLCFSDRMEFVTCWYFLIIVNDILTIIGAAFKIQLETREATITSYNYDICSLMLGLGGLLAWIGCLRYLSFFKKYNILLLTLKTAFPNVLRFSLCALAMYGGFMFCGWVILSPYHIKFRQLSSTSECLFSLVNGDDMFVTFSATVTNNLVVWYFSRIYLYSFISLFIYCVLSLFISVIMDTYETLKECYEHGFPKTELQHFIEECNHPLHSGLYRRQHTENEAYDWSLIEVLAKCCCRKKTSAELDEQRPLLIQTL